MTLTNNKLTATKVEPTSLKDIQAEPEIVVAEAVSQEEAIPSTPSAFTPLNEQHQEHTHKNETGFDILCCGDDTRKGIRVRPGTNFVIKLCGNTNIILPTDPPTGATYKFIIMNLCGDARFMVPNGSNIVLRRIALCGNRTVDVDDVPEVDNTLSAITVKVTILQLCGDIHVSHYE